MRQVRYQLLTFRRTPIALFFTIAFPMIFFVLICTVYGNEDIAVGDGTWKVANFYTGGVAAFAAVTATYTNFANMIPIRRDTGVMKRWRGTPLPTIVYMAGFVGSAIVLAFIGSALMMIVGVVGYGVEFEVAKLPSIVLTFVVGVTSWSALGFAVAGLVPTASSAGAVANATILPLGFISDVFLQTGDNDLGILSDIASVFPLKPFANSFQDAFNPFVDAPAIDIGNLLVIAAWGAVGVVVGLRYFRWEPNPAGLSTRRRGRRATSVNRGDELEVANSGR